MAFITKVGQVVAQLGQIRISPIELPSAILVKPTTGNTGIGGALNVPVIDGTIATGNLSVLRPAQKILVEKRNLENEAKLESVLPSPISDGPGRALFYVAIGFFAIKFLPKLFR